MVRMANISCEHEHDMHAQPPAVKFCGERTGEKHRFIVQYCNAGRAEEREACIVQVSFVLVKQCRSVIPARDL